MSIVQNARTKVNRELFKIDFAEVTMRNLNVQSLFAESIFVGLNPLIQFQNITVVEGWLPALPLITIDFT